MNIETLKEAENTFLNMYPEGFQDSEMVKVGKKHRMDKMIKMAHENLSEETLKKSGEDVVEGIIKIVTSSSMVSLFEKPKFRDIVRTMSDEQKKQLVSSIRELVHGDEEKGFNDLLELLAYYKLARWTFITVFRCYYYPDTDLLYKPITVKGVIKKFELEDLVYKPRPSYDFFVRYRDEINEMKKYVNPSLTPNSAAFSGFLMFTM
jgi:hypothetical protein